MARVLFRKIHNTCTVIFSVFRPGTYPSGEGVMDDDMWGGCLSLTKMGWLAGDKQCF